MRKLLTHGIDYVAQKAGFRNNLCDFVQEKGVVNTEKIHQLKRCHDDFKRHLDVLKCCSKPFQEARCYTLGGGRDLFHNIALSMMGVSEQHLVDSKSYALASAINDVIHYFKHFELEGMLKKDFPYIRQKHLRDDLAAYYGIYYRAPMDPESTPFKSESMDFVLIQEVSGYGTPEKLKNVLNECQRLSHSKTRLSFILHDRVDEQASKYQKTIRNLRRYYSKGSSILNAFTRAHCRLRDSDYRALFLDAGMSIDHEHCAIGTKSIAVKNSPMPSHDTDPHSEGLLRQGKHFMLSKNR